MRVLPDTRASLPAEWYYDPAQYRRELAAVWYRDWICVGRDESLGSRGDYFVARIGEREVIVTRDGDGGLRAFLNACRHRGSVLCRDREGRFRNGRIICPYHTWTYALTGELLATPGRIDAPDFDAADFPLIAVHVDTWQGFVFVNLADEPAQTIDESLGEERSNLANWPLRTMRSVHRETMQLDCNWKIFWENYSECYHCPRVHPELCRVMPVYRRAVFDDADLPGWQPAFDGDSGAGRVADHMHTWTLDGRLAGPAIEGPSKAERESGVSFASFTANMFVVAHPDYVRSVRICPTGPETIELIADWLLPADTPDPDAEMLTAITELPTLVMRQDADVCELNQRGLRSFEGRHGVLVPQEYVVFEFHEWLRERLGSVPDRA